MLTRRFECPNCNTYGKMPIAITLGNFLRLVVDVVLGFILLFTGLAVLEWSKAMSYIIPLRRKCGACGTSFVAKIANQTARDRLTRCAKCSYSLLGNTSGRCPECGHEMTPDQQNHSEKLGTAHDTQG
jgi:DNA-directed RNA polymerase subunit RPC12/RpoP